MKQIKNFLYKPVIRVVIISFYYLVISVMIHVHFSYDISHKIQTIQLHVNNLMNW